MDITHVFARFPLFFSWVTVLGVSEVVADVLSALGANLLGNVGPTAMPIAAVVFGLCLLVAWVLCFPFRGNGRFIFFVALVLALGVQLALFEVFGTFMLYTPEEIDGNRVAMLVLIALEAAYAFMGMAIWSSLSYTARRRAHGV